MFSKRKSRLIAVMSAVVVIAFAGIPLGLHISAEMRKQQVSEAMFYCYALNMEVATDKRMSPIAGWPNLDKYPTAFMRVEYVMDYPPEDKFGWAVIYARPDERGVKYRTPEDRRNKENGISEGVGTQGRVDALNKLIASDPSIEVDRSLTLPLTVGQAVENPNAVLKIIKQLNRAQWEEFFNGPRLLAAKDLAPQAGIDVPTE